MGNWSKIDGSSRGESLIQIADSLFYKSWLAFDIIFIVSLSILIFCRDYTCSFNESKFESYIGWLDSCEVVGLSFWI